MQIRPLHQDDYAGWLELWQGYLQFYKAELSAETTAHTWANLLDDNPHIGGFVAHDETKDLVGFVHYIFHPVTWSIARRCYLEDLFTKTQTRGKGVGRTLILAVQELAVNRGADQVYWITDKENQPAQKLYDKLATKTGYIRYEIKT